MPKLEGMRQDRQDAAEILTAPRVLVVGDVKDWLAGGRSLPESDALSYIEYDDLTRSLLSRESPDVVMSSIITNTFDAFDLAQLLCDLGFQGRYRAFAPEIPKPELVRREISGICPELDFDVIQIDKGRSLRPH